MYSSCSGIRAAGRESDMASIITPPLTMRDGGIPALLTCARPRFGVRGFVFDIQRDLDAAQGNGNFCQWEFIVFRLPRLIWRARSTCGVGDCCGCWRWRCCFCALEVSMRRQSRPPSRLSPPAARRLASAATRGLPAVLAARAVRVLRRQRRRRRPLLASATALHPRSTRAVHSRQNRAAEHQLRAGIGAQGV